MYPSSKNNFLQSLHKDFIHFVSSFLSCSADSIFMLKILSNFSLHLSQTKSYAERHNLQLTLKLST